jgi:hypothetical protein
MPPRCRAGGRPGTVAALPATSATPGNHPADSPRGPRQRLMASPLRRVRPGRLIRRAARPTHGVALACRARGHGRPVSAHPIGCAHIKSGVRSTDTASLGDRQKCGASQPVVGRSEQSRRCCFVCCCCREVTPAQRRAIDGLGLTARCGSGGSSLPRQVWPGRLTRRAARPTAHGVALVCRARGHGRPVSAHPIGCAHIKSGVCSTDTASLGDRQKCGRPSRPSAGSEQQRHRCCAVTLRHEQHTPGRATDRGPTPHHVARPASAGEPDPRPTTSAPRTPQPPAQLTPAQGGPNGRRVAARCRSPAGSVDTGQGQRSSADEGVPQ